MRALFASPLGFAIGVSLGALGGGGSILAVPALAYAAGLTPGEATTTSLLLVGAASIVGMVGHARAGRVAFGTGVAFGLTGVGGSLAGTMLNRHIDPTVLMLGFAALVLIAAWRMLAGCPTCSRVGERSVIDSVTATSLDAWTSQRRRAMTVLIAGTCVGFLTGLFGVGGGFVIVPALTLGLRMPMPRAVGTSLLVIAINSAIGLLARSSTGGVPWSAAIPFVVASIGGVIYGSRVADRLDPRRSVRAFAALLVAVAVYTAVRSGATA